MKIAIMSFINAALRYGAGAVSRFMHLTAMCMTIVFLHVGKNDIAHIDGQIAQDILSLSKNLNCIVNKAIVSGLIRCYDYLKQKTFEICV